MQIRPPIRVPVTPDPVFTLFNTTGAVDTIYFGRFAGVDDYAINSEILSLPFSTISNVATSYSQHVLTNTSNESNIAGVRCPYTGSGDKTYCTISHTLTNTAFNLTNANSFTLTYQMKHDANAFGDTSCITILDMCTDNIDKAGIIVESSSDAVSVYVYDDASGIHTTSLLYTDVHYYGYPASGQIEPNVAFQIVGELASGNWVDEVAAVTLTKAGTPTYSQPGFNGFAANFHGVKFNANGDFFRNSSPVPELDLGTANFTLEWNMLLSAVAQDSTVMYAYDSVPNGYILMLQAINKGYFYFEATDGTTLLWQPDMTTPFDGAQHAYRIKCTGRGTGAAQLEFFMDGVSQGTQAFTTLNGKSITAGQAIVGWNQAIAYKCDGTLYEFRLSNNGTNDSFGYTTPGAGDNFWKSGDFVTYRWVFDKAEAKGTLYTKIAGELETNQADFCVQMGTAFSALGAITFTGGTESNFSFLGNGGTTPAGGITANLYQFGFAKGTTYNPGELP